MILIFYNLFFIIYDVRYFLFYYHRMHPLYNGKLIDLKSLSFILAKTSPFTDNTTLYVMSILLEAL